MSSIVIQTITPAGVGPTYQAATASDAVQGAPSDETLFIHAKNSNASTATITINPVSPTSVKVPGVGTVVIPPLSVVVPATTGDRMIGPIPAAYIDATGQITLVNTGVITNLTVAAIRAPRQSS